MTNYERLLIEVLSQINEDDKAIDVVSIALEKFVDCGVELHCFEDGYVDVYVKPKYLDYARASVQRYQIDNVIKIKNIKDV